MKNILASGIITLLILMPVSSAFIISSPVTPDVYLIPDDVSKWTAMFYFDGDQSNTTYSLSDKMLADLSNLEKIGSISDVNLVVLMDLDGANDSHLYYVNKGGVTEKPLTSINASWTNELDMGDENTLTDFMWWAVDNYPANHYNVYLNNHGGGWLGICVDEHPTQNILNMTELKNAFSEINGKIGRKIDVVSMDGCLMAMTEVVYQLKNDIDYLVASESFIHTHEEDGGLFLNWMVDEIYGNLVNDSSMTARELCIESVDDFRTDKAYILPPTIIKPQAVDCISAIDVSKIDIVASAVDEMANRLLLKPLLSRLFFPSVFLKTQSFSGGFDFLGLLSYYPYLDLYDLSLNIKKIIPDKNIKESADKVMESVLDAVIAERHGEKRIKGEHPGAHGLSIYLPYRKSAYNEGYESLDFAKDSQWDEFIKNRWFLHL